MDSGTSTKRDDIERAALALFAERGFHGTAMPDLAAVAGVGPGTIYRHFESKEALVNALYRKWKNQLSLEVYGNLPIHVPWRERFRAVWTALFAFRRAHPGVIEFLDLHHHGDYLDAQSRQIEQASANLLTTMVTLAQAEQILADLPPPALIALVYGTFLALLRAEDEGFVTLDDALIAATEERVWAAIRR